MATTTIVTDQAQSVNLDTYSTGDGVNFVDLNGKLVDFDYEKNGNNVVLSTDVSFYATVKVDKDFVVDGHLEQVENGTWSASNERKYTEGYGKQSIVNALESGTWKKDDRIVNLAEYKALEDKTGYEFQGGTLRLTIETHLGHSEGSYNSYYFSTGTLYNLESSYNTTGGYQYGPQDVHMLFDKTDLSNILAGNFSGTTGFYGADVENVKAHYGTDADINITDLHIYQVVNGGEPIDVTTSYLATAADSAYNEKLYNAEQNDITVTVKDYATDNKANTNIFVNKDETHDGLNLAEAEYPVVADGDYAATWLKEDITVVGDAVISDSYEGDSIFFKDLSGDAIDYTATKVEDDVVLSTNIQYYAKVTISANGEANPYVSDSNGKNYMQAGEYTAHLALVNTGAAAGHYMWKVDTPYGNVEHEDRYCFFGIGGDSFNFDEDGNVTSIEADTFSGLTYQFTGFYEVVNGGDPINVTKGYYDVVADVDSWETLYAAHQGLFESQGDLTATLDDYATVVYQGADVYANGTDNLSEATYAVNASGEYTATWLKEAITSTADTVITFNAETAAGDSLVFDTKSKNVYIERVGNDMVITNSDESLLAPVVTTIKDYYATTHAYDMSGQFGSVAMIATDGDTTLGAIPVTDISDVTVIKGTENADKISLTKVAADEKIAASDIFFNDVPHYDETTGKYTSRVTGESYKLENYANGMSGDDTINGTDGNDWINGSDGNDEIYGGIGGHDMLSGGDDEGADLIVAGRETQGNEAADITVEYKGEEHSLTLTDGTAELYGGAGDDVLVGGKGNDYIWGGAGHNTIYGGAGADTFDFTAREGGVFDTITDATKDDTIAIYGPNFKDMTFERGTGEQANDLIITVVGEGVGIGTGDTLTVKGYFDQAEADRVTKFQVGGELYNLEWHYSNVDKEYHMYNVTHNPDGAAVEGIRNWINGYTTEPVSITGKSAGDMLAGSINDDTITASDGGSELYGDAGDDHLIGGAGADYIRGKEGNDTLTGNGGADVFAIDSGNDVITDATSADVIKFVDDYRNDFTGITFAKGEGEKATSLMVSFGENSSVEIQNYFNADGTVAENHVNKFAIVTEEGTKEYTLGWHDGAMYNEIRNTDDKTITAVSGIQNWIDGQSKDASGKTITGGDKYDMLAGTQNADTITAGANGAEIYGDGGADTITATNSFIVGGSGIDTINVSGGNNTILFLNTPSLNPTENDSYATGTDTVNGATSGDVLKFAYTDKSVGYSVADLSFAKDGNNLVITAKKDATHENTVILTDFFESTDNVNKLWTTDGEKSIKDNAVINVVLTNGEAFDASLGGYNYAISGNGSVSNLGANDKIAMSGTTEYSFNDKGLLVEDGTNEITISDNTTGQTANVYVNGNADNITGKTLTVTKLTEFDATNLGYKNVEITGTDSADNFTGSTGDDTIYGKAGADVINGGAGIDEIQGGAGDDTIDGGAGADTFMYEANGTSFGHDTIKNATVDDVIKFSIVKDTITFDGEIKHKIESTAKFSDLVFEKSGNDLLIKIKDNTADDIKVEGFFTAGSKIDKIFAAENGTYSNTNQALKEYSIKNDAVFNVVLENGELFDKATSGYGDYRVAVSGNGSVSNLGANDKIATSGETVKYMRENDGGLIVWSGNGELQTDKITVTDFVFDGAHDINVNNGTTENMTLNVDLDGTVTYAATPYAEIFSGVGSVTGFVNSIDGVESDGSPVLIRRNNSADLNVDGITIKDFDFSTSNPFRIFDGNTSTQSTDYPINVTLYDVGDVPTEYQSTGYKEYIEGKGIVNLSGDHPFDLSQDAVYVDGWSAIHYTRENNGDLHFVQEDKTDITVKGFNFAGGTDFRVTDGTATELTTNMTIDVTLTGSDYVSAAGYAERITTTANSSVRFYPEDEYTGQDTLVFGTKNIAYKRNGEDLVITHHPDEYTEISTTVLGYYTSDNMAEEGQFARAQVSAGEINTTLGDLKVSYIENVSNITGTDNEEAIELVTTTGVIPQNASGDFPNYDEETGEYTSNVGHGKIKIDAYAAGMGGDDLIEGTEGNDWINGGDGGDTIYGGTSGKDMLAGGDGENLIYAGDFSGATPAPNTDGVEIYGGKDKDTIYVGGNNETENYIWAHGGDDKIYLNGGKNTIMLVEDGAEAKAGNDTIYGATSLDTLKFVSRDGDGEVIKGFAVSELSFAKSGDDLTITTPDASVTTIADFFKGQNVDTILTKDGEKSIKNDVVFDVVLDSEHPTFDKAESGYAGYRVNVIASDSAVKYTIEGLSATDNVTTGSATYKYTKYDGQLNKLFVNNVELVNYESDVKIDGNAIDYAHSTVNYIMSNQGSQYNPYNHGFGAALISGKGQINSFAFGENDKLVLDVTSVDGEGNPLYSFTYDDNKQNEQDALVITDGTNRFQVDGASVIYNKFIPPVKDLNLADVELDVVNVLNSFDATTFPGGFGSVNVSAYDSGVDVTLTGATGDDTLRGASGNDTITGGKGDDVLYGKGGNDTFVFNAEDGEDLIMDAKEGDIINFGNKKFSELGFIKNGDDLEIAYGTNDTVAVYDFFKGQNVDAILTSDSETPHSIKNDVIFNVVLDSEHPTFDKATSGYGDYKVAVSGNGSVTNLGDDDKLVVEEVSYARENNGGLVVGGAITVTDFDFTGGHDIKVNDGTTEGMTIDVTLTGILGAPYISASGYAERITSTASTAIQFYPEGHGKDTLVFDTDSQNVYCERIGNDYVITNSDDAENPVVTTVLGYYTSGDMSVEGRFAGVGMEATDGETIDTTTLGEITIEKISNVAYFDSGAVERDVDETVELTTGLEVSDIDPDKLALDTAGKVRINTTTEKYEYTSSAGYGTVALDAYALGRAGEDTITGTAGNDWINGGADDDAVFGGAGAADSHDMLSGHDGDDLVVAGEIVEEGTPGAINIGTPDDPQYVLLSDGNAEMYGGIGNDILFGGNANDYLDGGAGNDTLYGNGGDDKLISDAGDDEMYGGEGDDKFFIDGAGTKTVEGGDGNDTFNIIDTNAVVTIADATSADKISFAYLNNIGFNNLDFAQADEDLVITYKNILGADGKVVVEGYFDQAEANRLTTFNVKGTEYTLEWHYSNTKQDWAMYNVTKNPHGETVEGIRNWVSGPTNESVTIVGKDQYDMLAGGQNNDIITAGENSNGAELYGDAGDDWIVGDAGNDYIQGDGNNVPVGGDDKLYGMGGDDKLITDGGDDKVYGGDGDDKIFINGAGSKYVKGGDGKDTYNIIDLTADVEIADAEAADTLSFHHNHYKFSNLIFTRLGDDLTITFAGMDDNGSVFVDDFFASETPIDKVVAYDKNGVEQTYSILEDATILVDLDQFEGETYTATDYTELFTATEPASVKGLKEDDMILNGDETEFTRANGGPLVINNLITVEDFFTTGLDVDFTVNGESTEDANIAVTLSDGFVYNSTRYDETISGNGYVMGMEDGDALAIDGEVEYSRINGGGLTVSGFTGELLNDKITVMDFAFINDGDHDINVNGGTTADITINVTIKNDYTYDATSYTEVISGEGFVKGLTADDSIVDGTSTEFARFNNGGLIINGNIEVLDFFENGVDFNVNGDSTEHANIGVVLDDCDYAATRYAETISGTGTVEGLGANDTLVVDEVSYARENNGGLLVGGQLLVTDFDFTGGHDIKVNGGTTEGMTIDVTLNGIIGAPYESASGYAERITTNASTEIQFAENSDKDTLVFNTSADNLDYARDGKDLIITNGDVVTTVLGYYDSYKMEDAGLFSNVAVDTNTTDTTLGALSVTDIYNVSKVKGTNADEVIELAKVGADEVLTQPEGNDFPHYNPTTGEYTSNATGVTAKVESYAYANGGNDKVYGTDGNDWINGAAGNDVLYGGADGYDMLSGEAGNDVIIAGEAVAPETEGAVPYSGIADDGIYTVKLSDGSAEIYGGDGNDLLVGGNGDDFIIADDFSVTAADGDDTVYANGGNDHIRTGAGNDTIYAGEGADNIRVTGSGIKDIYGEDGIDTIDVRDLTAVINLKDATSADKLDFSKVENFGFNNMAFAKAGNNLEITYTELLGATGKVVVEGYFDQAEADRLTTFNVKGTEYTLKWLYSDVKGDYAMYNFTNDPNKLVNGIQNWLQDANPKSSDLGIIVSGKDEYDHLSGTDYSDLIGAGKNGAEIYAGKGSDVVYGNTGSDYLSGGEGNDNIYLNEEYAGGKDTICLVNPTGDLKAIGNDTIYGADSDDILKFALVSDGIKGYHFDELTFNRVGDNLEIVAGTANANGIPNKAIVDGFFTAENPVDTIYAANQYNTSLEGFSILNSATINVDLSQFEGTCKATDYQEIFTGSGSVEGVKADDKIVVDGTPVYTRTDNGGLTISTYSESGLLVNEITVEDFNFAGGHDIKVNEGTTADMTIGVKLTDALDGTYIAAAGYKENIEVTATNPVNVRGLAAGDNLAIGNDGFKFSRTYVGDNSGNDDILTITTADGSKVVNVEAYDFTATPAFTIGNTPIMINAPLDVTAKADYACSGAFSETVLVDGAIEVTNLGANDKLLFNEDAETTYALDKFAGLIIADGDGHSVTIEGIDTEADIIPANVGTFDDYEKDHLYNKTLKVSGYSEYDGSETAFGSLDITGTLGSDTLKGSDGNDIIDGLAQDDILTGGKGADTFVISAGNDTITDANAEDDIKFAGNFADLETDIQGTSLLIKSKGEGDAPISVEIENYFDENGKVVADAVDTLYALNSKGEYAEYSIADIRSGETYIDFTDYEFSDLTFNRNVSGEKPNDLVIKAGDKVEVLPDYFTMRNPEDNVRTKDGKFSVLADAEIVVTPTDDGYTGTKYNETVNLGADAGTYDMKTGVDKLNFTFESCGTETEPDFVMGDFIVKVTKGEQMFLNVPDTITVGATTFDVLQEFTVEGKDLVINVRYNSNEFIMGADPEYEHLGSITVKDAAGKNTGADIFVRNDGEFENVNSHPFIEFTEAEVTNKNTLTGSTLADDINVSNYITENGKGVKIDSKSGNDVIVGSNYNDTVKASSLEGEFATVTEYSGTNKITTGKGNDVINAYDYSSNTINAGAGNNAITLASVGKNTVTAKDGTNYIEIDEGSNSVKVGKGNNMFDINAGTNTIKTGAGENRFFVENGVNKITTGKNLDKFYIEGGNNTISSGAGADRFSIEGGSNTIKTGNAASWFYLAERADENETVYVNNITSGSKDDTFIISDGQNNIKSGSGVDKFYIGYTVNPLTDDPEANDTVNGGYNVINGGAGEDVFFINSGKNALNGAKGNDRYEVDLTNFNFNAGQIVVTDTAGKNILNAVVDSTGGVLDTLNVFFDVTVKTNKAGTKFKGATYSDMTFTTDVAGADGFDDLDGIDVTSKKAFNTINTYDGEGNSHSATISTKELDNLASDVAGWLFNKGYASTDDVFANEKNDGDIEALVAKYTTFSAHDYKMQ